MFTQPSRITLQVTPPQLSPHYSDFVQAQQQPVLWSNQETSPSNSPHLSPWRPQYPVFPSSQKLYRESSLPTVLGEVQSPWQFPWFVVFQIGRWWVRRRIVCGGDGSVSWMRGGERIPTLALLGTLLERRLGSLEIERGRVGWRWRRDPICRWRWDLMERKV